MNARKTPPKPLVLVTSCNQMMGEHPFHIAGQKYVDAVRLAGALPLIAPPFADADLDSLLDQVSGVLVTGSPSNLHPSHYGQALHDPSLPLDAERDAWTLKLIPAALARGLPLLAICRGTQEANVALGGTLHQAVQEVSGHHDHRAPDDQPAAVRYGQAHPVTVVPGGVLEQLLGTGPVDVNSIHGQGVDQLAPGLRVEARAPDGLVEAFSKPDAPGFNLCVQWHPEWLAADNPVSMKLLQAFGQAARSYHVRRDHTAPAASAVATQD